MTNVLLILQPGQSFELIMHVCVISYTAAAAEEENKCVDRLECIIPATVVPIVGVALIGLIAFLVIKKPCSE